MQTSLVNPQPANTFRLADALIRANKRFDMLVLPGQRHSYGPDTEYVNWARCDYFARYLLGDSSQTVDMTELARERAQNEKAAAAAGTATGIQQQRTQQQ